MKQHSTNYFNTFIEVAEDCPVSEGQMPPIKGEKRTVVNMQFDMLYEHPYEYTSDEILFTIFAQRKELPGFEWEDAREAFFSKGQPCMRTSPLARRYGWGVHSNKEGKIAIYGAETTEYQQFSKDTSINKTRAMRSKRKK